MNNTKFFDSASRRNVISILGLCIVLAVMFFFVSNLPDTAFGQGRGGDNGGRNDRGGPEDDDIELCGFAWGSTSEGSRMGAGWVSFNSKDCDVNGDGVLGNEGALTVPGCPASGSTSDYGVYVNEDDEIEGYAWSSNLGWIKFGGMSGTPTTGGNSRQQATVLGNGQVHGWARACAGTSSGTCSTMTARSDGWDGWVSLRGSNYGVSFSPDRQKFSGYSWGGPVVGWLNWDSGTGNGVRYCTARTLTVGLSASPNSGVAPLNGVDLTANILGTATGNSNIRFDCTNDGTYDITRNNISDTRHVEADACNYSTAGEYTAKVEVTRGGLTSTATTLITVNNDTSGEIGVVCSVSTPVYVNNPSTWTINVTPDDATPPYTYTFDFSDNQPDPEPITTSDESIVIERTFSTVGPKTLNVTVEDSQDIPATGSCMTNANVIVRPIIKEI